MQQRYLLTIHDLFTVRDGVRCGALGIVVAIPGSLGSPHDWFLIQGVSPSKRSARRRESA